MGLKVATFLLIVLMLTVVPIVDVFSFRVLCETVLRVHNSDTGLSYASIQEAIRANETLNGHTILVEAGFYCENVVVDKSVSLVPEGFGVVVDGGGNGTIFDVAADNVNITGFIIQNSGIEPNYVGIFLNRSSRCVISDNVIRSSYYGVRLYYAYDNALSSNTIYNCSYGIWLAYSEKNVLLDNCVFNNNHVGLHLSPSSHNTLSGNEAWNNEHGIYISDSENNTVTENRVLNNTFGIWLGSSVRNSVCSNGIYNNTYGIRLASSSINRVLENGFEGNDFGISLRNSNGNIVLHNNFSNNTEQTVTVNSIDSFDNGMEGNYWSDYDGLDGDNDGVGDTFYVIDQNNTDRHPLMGKSFGFSEVSDEEEYKFHIISNCSVSGFEFSSEFQMFRFRVSGLNGTACFCRVTFPRMVLAHPYVTVVDGVEVEAVLLPVSNISHVFLYFVFNMSSHEVVVGSRPFRELSEEYDTLVNAHNDLIANYTRLWADYLSLDASYNDTKNRLDSLQAMFDTLNSTYNYLVVDYERVKAELGDVRSLMYGFLAATVVGVVVSLVSFQFGFKYYKRFGEQRRIIEAYGLSPLEVAQALFELDVKKRGEKIEKFEEKYGVKIRPRASLEDIIEGLKSRKKRRS
jgi:parallel beta-helix repeat protein